MLSSIDWVAGSQIAVALGTAILAVATFQMARHAKAAADAASESAANARDHVQLATAAQIDSRAPLVVPFAMSPRGLPSADDPRRFPNRFQPDQEFALPESGNTRLWFRMQVLLRNEGRTSALIWGIADDGAFVPWGTVDDDLIPGDGLGPPPDFIQPPDLGRGRFLLPSGTMAVLDFAVSETLATFARAHELRSDAPSESKIRRRIIVGDQFDDGIADNLMFVLHGYPIEPHSGRWRFADTNGAPMMVATVEPIRRRRYRSRLDNEEHDSRST